MKSEEVADVCFRFRLTPLSARTATVAGCSRLRARSRHCRWNRWREAAHVHHAAGGKSSSGGVLFAGRCTRLISSCNSTSASGKRSGDAGVVGTSRKPRRSAVSGASCSFFCLRHVIGKDQGRDSNQLHQLSLRFCDELLLHHTQLAVLQLLRNSGISASLVAMRVVYLLDERQPAV